MIFQSIDKKISYYHAPKNGSRTMLGYLSLIANPNLIYTNPEYFESSTRGMDGIYPELRNLCKTNIITGLSRNYIPQTKSLIRIVIKRDPVQRFISGFNNRVVYFNCLNKQISFSEFLDNFEYYYKINDSIMEHFKPQVDFFGFNKKIFTHVYDLCEMDKVKTLLEITYNRKFPNLRLQQAGNENKVIITDSEIAKIRQIYRVDFESSWK